MKLIFILFIFLSSFISLSQCTIISDGTYGNSQTSPLSPMYGLFNYSWSSNIYYAADIGSSKTIYGIGWYVDEFQNGYSQSGPYTFSNIKVYFAYTTLNGWSNITNVSGVNRLTGINAAQGITSWTKVYDGSITFNSSNSWKSIQLSTPFSYNGTSNLVVHVENWDASWQSGYPIFHYTSTSSSGNRTMKYGAQDGSMGPTSGSRFYSRTDIQFCTSTSLPIELTSFKGTIGNKLEWTTSSEYNNDYFTLEKSTIGLEFYPIRIVKGAGNSRDVNSYVVVDGEFDDIINYYRLKQTDYDGVTKYSQSLSIDNRQKLKYVIKCVDMLGNVVSMDTKGIIIVIYDDGDIRKIVNE